MLLVWLSYRLLGRAVIGGLIFATAATLLFVPVVFSMVHSKRDDADSNVVPYEGFSRAAE